MVSAARRIELVPAEETERRARRDCSKEPELWALLDAVTDPEIPVLSLWDLGVLQNIERVGHRILVTLTPTYSGCPALSTMQEDIRARFAEAGLTDVDIVQVLSPAWSSQWLSQAAREKLTAYGIAPPGDERCPHCGSSNTHRVAEFGSTACKAMWRCDDCLEPFDQFKAI